MWFDFWCLCLDQVARHFRVDLLLCLLCLSWVCAMWFCFLLLCSCEFTFFECDLLWCVICLLLSLLDAVCFGCFMLVLLWEFVWCVVCFAWTVFVNILFFQVWSMWFDFCELTCCTVCGSCIALLWLDFLVSLDVLLFVIVLLYSLLFSGWVGVTSVCVFNLPMWLASVALTLVSVVFAPCDFILLLVYLYVRFALVELLWFEFVFFYLAMWLVFFWI